MRPRKEIPRPDPMNLRILRLLALDARRNYSEIASELGCSVNSARDRILAMERRGIIRGYTALLDESKLGRPVHAVVFLTGSSPVRPALLHELQNHDWVQHIFRGAGRYRLAIEAVACSMDELNRLVRIAVEGADLHITWTAQLAPVQPARPATTANLVHSPRVEPSAVSIR